MDVERGHSLHVAGAAFYCVSRWSLSNRQPRVGGRMAYLVTAVPRELKLSVLASSWSVLQLFSTYVTDM